MKKNYYEFLEEKIEFYDLMSLIFMQEPNDDFCCTLISILQEEYFPLSEMIPEIDSLHSQIQKSLTEKNATEFTETLKHEYYDLFFNPHGMKASPWQSSYTNRDHLLYQAPDYETKAFYRRYKCKLLNDRLPGDHISIELNFLKKLAEHEKMLFDTDKLVENTGVFQDNLEFIDKYVLSWIELFLKALRDSNSIYYLLFASMVKAASVFDKNYLHQLLRKEEED